MHLIGIDAGGTRTTLALADAEGRELLRREGPAGIVDPRDPEAAVGVMARLVREALAEAEIGAPVAALCVGVAGVRTEAEREVVGALLRAEGLAERVEVRSDGEIALEGALGGRPGVLLVAGTGSVAWGRGENGRVESCGGWGMVVGDEGSAYWMGRAALTAAVRAVDGRGAATRLLPALLTALTLDDPHPIRWWAGRAEKAEIAALAVEALRAAAQGDGVALGIVDEAVEGLVAHVGALLRRLGPWTAPPAVVLHGGLGVDALFRERLRAGLMALHPGLELRATAADAVAGAVRLAQRAVD